MTNPKGQKENIGSAEGIRIQHCFCFTELGCRTGLCTGTALVLDTDTAAAIDFT